MGLIRSSIVHWFLGIALALYSYFAFAIPIGGSLGDVVMLSMNGVVSHAPVRASLAGGISEQSGSFLVPIKDLYGEPGQLLLSPFDLEKLRNSKSFVADITYDAATKVFRNQSIIRIDPAISFPLIQGLGELGRNMLFHVPMSMVAFLAFLIGTIYSALYLWKRTPALDIKARAASAAALLFTGLATVTGSIWARFSWGSFWNWDPRETSIFVLLLLYAAYFILRSLLDEDEAKVARIAAVYNIIAFVSVPFLMFVLPRITRSLHPGGNGSEAPILNLSGKSHTDPTLLNTFWIGVILFAILYFWMSDLYSRTALLAKAERDAQLLNQ